MDEKQATEEASLLALPEKLLLEILQRLDWRSLVRVAGTCRRLSHLCRHRM